jgi:hypothetical protein
LFLPLASARLSLLIFLDDFCFLVAFFSIVETALEVSFILDVFLKVVEDVVLSQLKPKEVDVGVVGIVLLDSPPGSVGSEELFDEGAVIALADIENIVGGLFGQLHLEVVCEVDQA